MIKLKIIYIIVFMFLWITVIINNAYSEDTQTEDMYSKDNSQFDIRFANTISVGYFSNCFYNDNIRSKHSTILDKPAFNIDEKFQIILAVGNDNNEIKTIDTCCVSIPNSLYASINLLYSHYENFAVRTGIGFEGGFGDDKNPLLSGGIFLVYLHDMVFKNGGYDISYFINIGYKYDMHLFFDFSGVLNDAGGLYEYPYYYNFELTLGYKEFIPLFLKIKGSEITNNDKINYTDSIHYAYRQTMLLYHIQYYGDNFGLSIGFSEYRERYIESILNTEQTGYDYSDTIDKRHSRGGGMTFYIKNTANTFEFFGEFHLLTDKKNNWMTIAKFGSTVYF